MTLAQLSPVLGTIATWERFVLHFSHQAETKRTGMVLPPVPRRVPGMRLLVVCCGKIRAAAVGDLLRSTSNRILDSPNDSWRRFAQEAADLFQRLARQLHQPLACQVEDSDTDRPY